MENVKLLKFTIRGLNYRYNALKKINNLMGETHDLKDFLDKALGILIDIFAVESGSIFIKEKEDTLRIQVFRAEIPSNKEVAVKKEIEQINMPIRDILPSEGELDSKGLIINNTPDTSLKYRMLIENAIGRIKTIVTAPVRVKNKSIGLIELYNPIGQVKEDRRDALISIGNQIGISFELFEKLTVKDRRIKSILNLLSKTIDAKDRLFPAHTKMVKKYVQLLGKELKLNSEEMQHLDIAASVQDIGMLLVPEKILEKEGKLSHQEWGIIKKHPQKSVDILETVEEFKDIIPIIKYHHERYDGSGYPEKLSGDEIPKLATILSIADAYSALTGRRPYREQFKEEKAKQVLIEQKSKQFAPKLIDSFLKALENK